MGRCYEFGVVVQGGCEHAMVVTPEGGACACTDCGAHCTGRFAGCAEIIAVPGRVPPTAPPHATVGGDTSQQIVSIVRAPTPAAPASPAAAELDLEQVEQLRRLVALVAERSEETAGLAVAVEALGARLAERDSELAGAFDRLTDAYERLASEVRDVAERVEALQQDRRITLPSIFRRAE